MSGNEPTTAANSDRPLGFGEMEWTEEGLEDLRMAMNALRVQHLKGEEPSPSQAPAEEKES